MDASFTNDGWSKHAKVYEKVSMNLTAAWTRDALSIAHHRLHPRLMEHKSASDLPFEFLDVGCGPGVLSFEFATKYEAIGVPFHITATDLADGMLERVSARLHDDNSVYSRFADRVTTIQMDGRKLDKIPDASIDAIGSNFGLSIFPERTTGWASAHRVLRDDGLLIVTAWHPSSANVDWFGTLTALDDSAEADTDDLSSPSETPPDVSDSILEIQMELTATGFRGIEMYQTTHTIINAFDALPNVVLDNPVAAATLERCSKEIVAEEITRILRKQTDALSTQISVDGDTSKRTIALSEMTAVTFIARK